MQPISPDGYPPTAVSCPPTAVGYPPTAVGYPPRVLTRKKTCPGGGGGAVLLRPTPQLCQNWGGGWAGSLGGSAGGCKGGGGSAAGVVPKVGGPARDPLLPHAYLLGGCVSGGLGVWRYVCDNSASLSFLGSLKGRVAKLPPSPLPSLPYPLVPPRPRLVCEKNS